MQRRLGVGPAMASGTFTISMIDLYLAYLVLGSSPWEIDLHSRSNQGNKSFVIYPVNISDTGHLSIRMNSKSILSILHQQPASTGVWIQEGIVSFGPSTGCASGYPNGYSRIAHYLHFIQDITGIKMN